MELDPNDPESINAVSEDIQRLIISAKVPGSSRTPFLTPTGR